MSVDKWSLYEFQPSFVLGFHGCNESVGESLLRGEENHLKPSENDYDWLGTGIYFWEANPLRALQFAKERAEGGRNSRGEINSPFVVGAVINFGRCLNLTQGDALNQVKEAHETLVSSTKGVSLPGNGISLRARRLDCLVFNTLHVMRETRGLSKYDTVRGTFWEGEELYPGAGLREADHVQICVRNPACILGYFRPIELA